MNIPSYQDLPREAVDAAEVIQKLLNRSVLGIYLYGSAIAGGLRRDSDIDILVITHQGLPENSRMKLAVELMLISGKVGGTDSARPLEVTVVNTSDIVPWKYPPKKEFIYGEWLREDYILGQIPEPSDDPDLTILLYQARKTSIPIFGPQAAEMLPPVPTADLRRAMRDCVPGLRSYLKGDERNVLLTFARIWATAATGEIMPKDAAAQYVTPYLPKQHAVLLDIAAKAYRGERTDHWIGLDSEVNALVEYMTAEIEALLGEKV